MHNLWQAVDAHFARKDVAGAVDLLERFLASQDAQQFSCLSGLTFTSTNTAVLGEINRFVAASDEQFEVRAVYLEMNGFDVNYDRWYFDFFAYERYEPSVDETEWLCDWQSGEWPEFELMGMRRAQEAFAWYHEERIWESQPEFKPTYEAAMLLVMAKFAAFIGSSLEVGKLVKPIPVLATAHDFQSIARYEP